MTPFSRLLVDDGVWARAPPGGLACNWFAGCVGLRMGPNPTPRQSLLHPCVTPLLLSTMRLQVLPPRSIGYVKPQARPLRLPLRATDDDKPSSSDEDAKRGSRVREIELPKTGYFSLADTEMEVRPGACECCSCVPCTALYLYRLFLPARRSIPRPRRGSTLRTRADGTRTSSSGTRIGRQAKHSIALRQWQHAWHAPPWTLRNRCTHQL